MALSLDAQNSSLENEMEYLSNEDNENKKSSDTLRNLDNHQTTKALRQKKFIKIDPELRSCKEEIKRLKRELAGALALIKWNTNPSSNMVSTQNSFDALKNLEDMPSPKTSAAPTPAPSNLVLCRTPTEKSVKQGKRPAPEPSVSNTGAIPKKTKTNPKQDTPVVIKQHKPPPIVVSNLDCKEMSKHLSQKIGPDAFQYRRLNANTTHIQTKKLADFKSVQELLQQAKAPHHTFTPKEEQNANLVLRHLDVSYEEADITSAINEMGLDIELLKVMRLPSKFNNLWIIQLKAGSDVKQLLSQRYMLHQNIVFERKKQSGIAQCKNCQLFGHSARNCGRKFRCVKCKEDHSPGQCRRTLSPQLAKDTLPSCVNCNSDEHPANFRGCPFYLKVVQQKQNQTKQLPQTKKTAPQHPHQAASATCVEGISYASAVSSSPNNRQQPKNVHNFFENEFNEYFNVGFTDLLSQMKSFYPKYIAMPKEQRALALMNLTMSLAK